MSGICVYSEIGKLKEVLVHKPGKELENLIPNNLKDLLFDDTPFLIKAQEEHDTFTQTLRNLGIKVHYVEDLAAAAIDQGNIKEQFVEQFIKELEPIGPNKHLALKEFFMNFSTKALVDKAIAGTRMNELDYSGTSLASYTDDNLFICDPIPNILFTRDPFASIANTAFINYMKFPTRRRETIFAEYIFKYHNNYKNITSFNGRNLGVSIEGGDILVLNEEIIAVGISERTQGAAIDALAQFLFLEIESSFKKIVAISIPKKRAFMHLDTVFTQIDKNLFIIYPEIEDPLALYTLTRDKKTKNDIKIQRSRLTLDRVLSDCLETEVEFIKCAGGDPIAAQRGQWNDATNTLAVAPRAVVVYDRNHVTNKILRESGIKVHEIPSGELSRGRGGPRCMSMPLVRELII